MASEELLCPICAQSCEITEEDLIDADCGACGSVTIHVHCKEKYCKQQGIVPLPCPSFPPLRFTCKGTRLLGSVAPRRYT